MTNLVETYPGELESLEAQVAQLMRPRLAEMAVFVLLAFLGICIWKEVSLNGVDLIIWALAFVEPFALLATGDVLTRVEYVIHNPVIGVLAVSAFVVWLKSKDIKKAELRNVAVVLVIDAIMMYTRLDLKINHSRLYYVHYAVLATMIYRDCQQLKGSLPSTLIVLSPVSVALSFMLAYEAITDYSQTDQTESMILLIRILYSFFLGCLLAYTKAPKPVLAKTFCYLPILFYYFLADAQQRSFLLFFYLPAVTPSQTELIAKATLNNKSAYALLIYHSTACFLYNKGSCGFDISLRAGNHSWGTYPDEYPFVTGFVFGFHKVGWFVLAGSIVMRYAESKFYSRGLKLTSLRVLGALWTFVCVTYNFPNNSLSVFLWAAFQVCGLLCSHTFGLTLMQRDQGKGQKSSSN